MILKNNTRKQFLAMFCQAMKPASIMAILALICFLFLTSFAFGTYEPDYYRETAHFFDELRWNGIEDMANLAFIGAGVLNAMLCFNFAWSKKQANVVLSLGMKKSDIYFAKILGGIVPMGVAITLAGVIETIANVSGNYIVNGRFFAMAAFTMLQYLVIYILSFVLSSAVMANTGNVVEGIIFTGVIALLPMTLKSFLVNTFWQFTHGAYIAPKSNVYVPEWNWSDPFEAFANFDYSFMSTYFEQDNTVLPSVIHWSGVIMAAIYAVVIVLLGYLGFKKRRNEICGTWGRAKGMNEIVAAVTGFYASYLIGLYIFSLSHGDSGILTYIICCVSFLVAYVVFKMIFGYKRKKEVMASFSRFPVYAMGLAAVFMVFSLGLFGYSSKVPEADEIKSVSVSSPYYKAMDEGFAGSSEFALKLSLMENYAVFPELDGTMYSGGVLESPKITYTDYQDIEKAVDIHKSFVRDGKIKNNGAHSCASNVIITYTLKNGKEITRYYTEATEGTTLKLLTLNDSDELNRVLFDYLNNGLDFNYYREIAINKNEDGYLDLDTYTEKYGEDYPDTETYEWFSSDFSYSLSSMAYLAQKPCYIFPTDMSTGYKLGYIEKELYDAIATDLKNLSANQYFNHSAEDEIGVLSFGLSDSTYMSWGVSGEVVYADKYTTDTENENSPDGTFHKTSWNINSFDIKAIVVTKDMKNTIAYLEEHDLMKHFERKLNVDDVKSVKLATMSELCDGNYENSEIFPIFYGAFWTGEQMDEWVKENSINHYYYRMFDHIHNEITDKAQIEKLLGEGVIFGYCASDSRIMEITYEDGSVATVMVAQTTT
ncbi:MAG: hypothetical protein IJ447_03860 [Clostridia bacterium]|nr:hypothetical protein [Clostridia bacterium]